MKNRKWLTILFVTAGIILISVLGWGGYIYYNWQQQRINDKVATIIKSTARQVQNKNMIINNYAGILNDSMRAEKIAFAIGVTENMGKMRLWFDEDQDNQRKRIEEQNKQAEKDTIVHKALDINKHFVQKLNIRYLPNSVKKISYFDSLFKHNLDSNHVQIQYHIHRLTPENVGYKTSYDYFSNGFIINYYNPRVFRVEYNILRKGVLIATLPYIGLSILLLGLFLLSYILLVRSYRLQLQMVQFRETLFSNVTHELKTPLSSLKIIINEADKGDVPVISKEHLHFAGSELNRMSLLVDKIISFGKMNYEQFDLNKSILNADELIKEAIEAVSITLGQTGAVVHYQSPDVKINITGDRALLINMVITLIDNAIKYNQQKAVINISLQKEQQNVIIKIADNGIGIPAVYHKRIFDPFFRIPTGNVHNTKGHGLGLSFAAQVVKLHHGEIHISSTENKGSTFIINLPAS